MRKRGSEREMKRGKWLKVFDRQYKNKRWEKRTKKQVETNEKKKRKKWERKKKEKRKKEKDVSWLVYLEMISNVLTIVLKILENSIWINSSQRIEIILGN